MTELQALIFDVDGTLADTERDGHRVAFNRAFAEAKLDWNWSVELYRELLAIAGGKERIRFYIDQYCPEFNPMNLDRLIGDLHAAKNQHYQQLLAQGAIPLRPGVRRLIEQARSENLRIAIATTSALPNVIALLQHALAPDSPNWFEAIAAGDIVPAKKPAPDIYYHVLKAMNLQARDCLVFEDSEHGLWAASQAGLKTVVTFNEYTQHHDFTGAALVLDCLGERDRPFIVKTGEIKDKTYFDLALAQHLHRFKAEDA